MFVSRQLFSRPSRAKEPWQRFAQWDRRQNPVDTADPRIEDRRPKPRIKYPYHKHRKSDPKYLQTQINGYPGRHPLTLQVSYHLDTRAVHFWDFKKKIEQVCPVHLETQILNSPADRNRLEISWRGQSLLVLASPQDSLEDPTTFSQFAQQLLHLRTKLC